MAHLPTGTVTFLLTDIEGSTRLWEQYPEAMRTALARHYALLTALIEQRGGRVVKSQGEGDSLFAVFARADAAVAAACALQQALHAEPWPAETPLRVRVALHSGAAALREDDYFGPAVNRCARLRSAGHGGQILLSLATQEQLRNPLPEGSSLRDLGERRLKDLIRPERVFQLLVPNLPQEFPPLNTLELRPNNLPAQATALIGRETEVAAARDLLRRSEVRLVTLTGPGGTGKTRLGLQVAADRVDEYEGGVFFVELAPISDPGLVASTIAQALGVQESGGTPPRESLKEYLREKQLLLCLDNFEQVLEAASLVAELLAAAPRLKVLVTSRAVLRVRGEHEFAVPSLGLPDLQRLPPAETLSQYAAVELFVQRAVAVRADFAVTDANGPAVAEICSRLDGLPLAIELAAARAKLLSPQAMLARMESRLKLLAGGARDLPMRQQTLRNTIAWSYDLIEPHEQQIFRRVSVFVGGCTLEAVESVCQIEADPEIDLFEALASLVDKSLLRRLEDAGAGPRFGMLETIREYGLERLSEAGEIDELRRQHATFFLTLAEKAGSEAEGSKAGDWADWLEREQDNLRAALRWSVADGAAEAALRVVLALYFFWRRGRWTEARELLGTLQALPGVSVSSRAKALHMGGVFAWETGDFEQAQALSKESLALFQEQGDKEYVARALSIWSIATRDRGDLAQALALEQQSLSVSREAQFAWGIARSLYNIGLLTLDQGNWEEGKQQIEEALVLLRQDGAKTHVVNALGTLGDLAFRQQQYDQAHMRYTEGLALSRELRDTWDVVLALNRLGRLARSKGEYERARSHYVECLTLLQELGAKSGFASSARGMQSLAGALRGLANLEMAQEQPQRAVRLAAAAEGLLEAAEAQLNALRRPEPGPSEAIARARLGEEQFAIARAEGRAMTPEEAVRYALEHAATNSSAARESEKEG